MAYEKFTPVGERYFNLSQDRERDPAAIYFYGSQEVQNNYFEKFQRDAALLKEALSIDSGGRDATLAERVFGSQARQEKIGLGHLSNILYERAVLHKKHLRDIDWRLTDCLDRLSVLKMQFPLDGGRAQQHLEKLIIALEKQRHEEETSFWKDSAEIRQQLFESAATYSAANRRKDMLSGVEEGDV
jgi:hypothetical protein